MLKVIVKYIRAYCLTIYHFALDLLSHLYYCYYIWALFGIQFLETLQSFDFLYLSCYFLPNCIILAILQSKGMPKYLTSFGSSHELVFMNINIEKIAVFKHRLNIIRNNLQFPFFYRNFIKK